MKRLMPFLSLALAAAICAPASGQYAVYTVTGAAVATGSQFFPLQQAFDSQPTWDSQAGAPTGGGTAGSDAPYYAGRWGYIDFGPDWANVHIVQTWTLYRTWSGGNQTPYANMWWDDDIDTTNDNGVVESTLQFNSAQSVPNVSYVQWIRDTDASSSPVVPQRRYLLLHAPNPMTNRAKEYAIIVQTNFAPTADAGDDAVVTLAAGASLDGTVSDDGMPNPPGALTTTWTMTSGPGTVTFGNASAVDTTASFSSAGTYVLRLTANDSSLQAYDEVTIEVYGETIVTPTAAGAASGSSYFPLNTGDFRLMDRCVVDQLNAMPERDRFIRGMVSWIGFRQTKVEYDRAKRFAGESKYPLRKMLKFATDGILSFSDKPLRLAANLGFIVSIFAALLIFYALYKRLFTNDWVSGWTFLFIMTVFLGGVQLICLGIIGEYVGRIYGEAKGRPLYILDETHRPLARNTEETPPIGIER